MRRIVDRLLAGGAALALALFLTGCGGGEGKKVEPKIEGNAPKVDEKSQEMKGKAE